MNTPRLILTSALAGTGQDARTLAKLCKAGFLKRVRQGVYVKTKNWSQLTPKTKYGLTAEALRHLAATEPVFCYVTAGLLWGLWIVGVPHDLYVRTEVTIGGRSSQGVKRFLGAPTDGVERCGQLLITDKLTTTIALINKFDFPYAVAVCDSSLRPLDSKTQVNTFTAPDREQSGDAFWDTDSPQGEPLRKDELLAAAARLPSRAARERATAVIHFASALSGSAGESISRAKMFQLGFPAPVLQQPFRLRDGKVAQVDFWFKELGLAGEFDGKAKYLRTDWAGGSMQNRLWEEKQREDQIRVQGVHFVRWTWQELLDTKAFAQLLRAAGLHQGKPRKQK